MELNGKIPVIVGVTGHRNIVEEDKPKIKECVIDSLKEIQELCKSDDGNDTPVIMLNAFAQGADMLCAEAAFELGIGVCALLPCEEEKYKQSFNLYTKPFNDAGITSGKEYEEALSKDEADKKKLDDYLSKVRQQKGRVIYPPDIEKNKQWLKRNINIDDDSYGYRQLGIYMAEHSHILIALWDGKPPATKFGCGTVEVIKFALEHKFLDKDHLFKPGTINDSAVVWIKSRRQGDGAEADIRKKWIISNLENCEEQKPDEEPKPDHIDSDEPPKFLEEIIAKTVNYNRNRVEVSAESSELWANYGSLDEYRKTLSYHYTKANLLSYRKNQKLYNIFLLLIAIIGTAVACTFLIYDDASLPFMIFPCSLSVGAILCLCHIGRKKAYHKSYIDYRALAEALRIQFYTSMCMKEEELINVCDLYSWTQRVDSVWIEKAVRAIAVTSEIVKIKIDPSEVIEAWIGKGKTGQLAYHVRKKDTNRKQAKKYEMAAKVFRIAAVVIYFAIFAFEIAACVLKACDISWFWESNIFAHIAWRNFFAMILGVFAAGSLLFSSYWGKLSFDRKLEDNEKMCEFYASAYARWNEAKEHPNGEIEKFVREIAREEIVENGIWYSYVKGNGLEVNI